ncbi:putative methyltransferase TARBP1 [Lucilia cuprina]|nr:putative methyltransferase TARBP1 [Lucilia cuprina]KAI8130850.1 putative methyltransferase TARBP1 [Lucilia cuprina]
MEPEKLNFQNFVELQKCLMESFIDGANIICPTELKLDEMLQYFNEHFNEFHQKENLLVVLAFIHRSLKMWINREEHLKNDIGVILLKFIEDHGEDESDLNIVVQIVYQIMNSIRTIGNKDVQISEKLLYQLTLIMQNVKNRTLISGCVACIQLYLKMFPESCKILTELWKNIKCKLETNAKKDIIQETDIDIIIQLIDDFHIIHSNFHEEATLITTIQQLLKSNQRKYRKCGYFLLKKVLQYFVEYITSVTAMWTSCDYNRKIEQSWLMYITILENLEEEQSHLILPSLENLEEIIKCKHLKSSWLDILYMRILTHNNNLVLRWSIEFFLKTFSCSNLSAHILKHFLNATNSTLLYNYEGYFLNRDLFSSFLKGDLINLLTLLPEVENWKSVPLYIWLQNLSKVQLPNRLNFQVILNICACVRKLQNCTVRQESINLCYKLFEGSLMHLSMEEYVTYVETLYNSSDYYDEYEMFYNKKSLLIEANPKGVIFKQRFYEIFTNSLGENDHLFMFLNDIPVEKHGWLKYALFQFEIPESDVKYIKDFYKIDLNSLTHCDLHKVINIFQDSLLGSPPYDKHELNVCNQAAISFYIYQKDDFANENEDTLRFILNSGGKLNVLETFAEKFLNKCKKVIDMWFIDELLKYNYKVILNCVADYLQRVCDYDVVHKYALIIFKKYEYIPSAFSEMNLLKICTNELLNELASKGENSVLLGIHNHFDTEIPPVRSYTLKQIKSFCNTQFILDLLKYHMHLTKKKPRYFENSNEHRIKLRIAICIYYGCNNMYKTAISVDILDQIWNILLNENNQLNIVYFYEHILAIYEMREEVILSKLQQAHNLTSCQQVSIMSVVYTYVLTHRTDDNHTKFTIVSNLLALTMGANFQTRLFAQMYLYQLLKKDSFQNINGFSQIINSIKYATGTKLTEHLNDIRVQINNFKIDYIIDIILNVTNAPFDEVFNIHLNNYNNELMKVCRETFMKKFKASTTDDILPKTPLNDQIQRKMNPINDLTEPHNLILYPKEEKPAEMFVIASLIDKLPNLGGIARTCEVLGIQNLVMASKMDTSKNDFKNLSMTAEKSLNILEVKPKDLKEFLMQKKLEGYAIIGAEQTCNSQNFSNFTFPQKCVLLLGHEKDGIPAPLLGLLDYAVEIPQFGQIRSLNVHVTGALFMWEFCKQHLVSQQ